MKQSAIFAAAALVTMLARGAPAEPHGHGASLRTHHGQPAAAAIEAHLAGAARPPSSATRMATREMQALGEAAVRTLDDELRATPFEEAGRRYALVDALGMVGHPAAVAPLARLLRERPTGAAGGHDLSPRAHEVVLRIRAAEGLAGLAASGQPEAIAALRTAAVSAERTVGLAAAMSLLAAVPEERAALAAALPPDRQDFLQVQLVSDPGEPPPHSPHGHPGHGGGER